MRLRALDHSGSLDRADDLVARALIRAIADIDGFSTWRYVEPWLLSHLDAEIASETLSPHH